LKWRSHSAPPLRRIASPRQAGRLLQIPETLPISRPFGEKSKLAEGEGLLRASSMMPTFIAKRCTEHSTVSGKVVATPSNPSDRRRSRAGCSRLATGQISDCRCSLHHFPMSLASRSSIFPELIPEPFPNVRPRFHRTFRRTFHQTVRGLITLGRGEPGAFRPISPRATAKRK